MIQLNAILQANGQAFGFHTISEQDLDACEVLVREKLIPQLRQREESLGAVEFRLQMPCGGEILRSGSVP